MKTASSKLPIYVQEEADPYLALFPHRYDYIWAEHSGVSHSGKLEWRTESRHPLSDRLIRQGAFLYGVRFGQQTQYCLLDIDAGSSYHPNRDPFAILRIVAALESLGLVSYVACTSSYSGGLHLYFPFEEAQKTWAIAVALEALLQNAGFKIALGQLEIFPNVKPYVVSGKPTLYAAHRLPMQAGSYLLNSNWETIYSNQQAFAQSWQFAMSRNVLSADILHRVLQTARRQQYCLSGKADKFLNDLNAEIEVGWTGYGQTNFILGRIAMRSYVFGHILNCSRVLEGQALVDDIVRVAKSLPGYEQWCRHQHEIEQRAEEWARCVESSHYFHYGHRKLSSVDEKRLPTQLFDPEKQTWNQQQRESARERIRGAIADLLNQNALPATATARFHALRRYGVGGGSLYRHRDLWHPLHLSEGSLDSVVNTSGTSVARTSQLLEKPEDCLQLPHPEELRRLKGTVIPEDLASKNLPVENPPDPPTISGASGWECVGDASHPEDSTSLFEITGGEALRRAASGTFQKAKLLTSGGNFSENDSAVEHGRSPQGQQIPPEQSQTEQSQTEQPQIRNHVSWIRQILAEVKRKQESAQILQDGEKRSQSELQISQMQTRQKMSEEKHHALMQSYLNSGDPILIAEALTWR